ncbi:hypothetical protein OESDEN_04613 [Oesophagostomum dentatum]|uniref:Maestro/Maestro-like HEAT-repeats domain-containing protein n=1 Tax=Oesophagostomum dentatum TaxID=61180 RepID=A0A0B1TH54_OESDE|nr:hypothetical protein OESDEN_04613 [Oesophagostomum dentatum]
MAVEAAMGGLDDLGDKNDTVAMESIIALNKLVSKTNDTQLHSILRQVLLKIRPCFEKESAALRAASFSLFGELGARIGGDEEFMAHLHANIVAILLHLNDEDEDACSMALNRIHPLFSVGTFSSVIEREMKDGRLPGSYFGVQRDLASILVGFVVLFDLEPSVVVP